MSKNQEKVTISIETLTIIKGLVLVALMLTLLSVLHAIAQPLVWLSISFFLAIALNPAVSWLAKRLKSNSRVKATAIAYIIAIATIVAFFSLVIPPLAKQTVDFVKSVPQTIEDLKSSDSPAGRFVERYSLQDEVNNLAKDISSKTSDISQPAISTATTIGTTLAGTITILVLTFMMLVEGPKWLERILAIQPASKKAHRKQTVERMYKVVTGYVNGQLLIAFIAGVFACIALLIANQVFDTSVNAIALGGIVGVFALMPLIGATLGAVIVVTACLFVSLPLAIAMTVYFVIYQQIENITLQPYIQSRSNQLTPLIVFVAAILGASIGGLLGALVAIPVAGCARILIESHYQERLKKAKLI